MRGARSAETSWGARSAEGTVDRPLLLHPESGCENNLTNCADYTFVFLELRIFEFLWLVSV